MIKVFSPAKINCFLYVTGKRDDGYHELSSLMTCLEFYDEIEIEQTLNNEIEVFCDHPLVPQDETNIAYKAAYLFFENLGLVKSVQKTGVSIKIKKKIPVGAGLGGGSSNAASVLMALNSLHDNAFSKSELLKIATLLGADVPFFIFGSPAVARGIGEKLEKCSTLVPYHILICYPGVSASTAKVFKNIDIKLTGKRKLDIDTWLNNWLDIWNKALKVDAVKYLHNDLENTAYKLYPDILYTKEEMEFVLSEKVCMTGSGSSLFVFFADYGKAKKAYSLLSDKFEGSLKEVILTSFKI
ncbi:MAG: 4-(cytidine 5'-diphospho)-2-C-methyl-D-erythritol kinase [Desulfobacterales bacterium]|nr:4-(cytidine 5'-diphospho)-2-C-methyl-D-erythritol kinase [Desulfobacterales bacterium]